MQTNIVTFQCRADGEIPNNEKLPIIIYQQAFVHAPENIELAFNRHGWTNSWINGIFDYHHYHTNTHEVLGVRAGTAVVQIGGEQGKQIELKTGDVIVLPAGTGHKRLNQSSDFLVVGAYPDGRSPNVKKQDPGSQAEALMEIKQVPRAETDPVFGEKGPLLDYWKD
ncbi:cupin domain-containing protein [Domibacillus robiginosus]|uniref:cupin domain-containing protein n=1 Tax=Domibacillus robiginosus TaxID=1071054 RepID=UPI00067C22A8|nr:cupin domain-containing protein [Domibacillus robiginosus]